MRWGTLRFLLVLLLPDFIFLQTITHGYTIDEEYSQEQNLLNMVANAVSHVIDVRPSTRMSYYCVLLSGPPGGRPSSILDMLQLTQKSQIIVKTWPNVSSSDTEPRSRNCSDCQSYIIFTGMNDVEDVLNRVRVTCAGERIEFLVVVCDVLESDAAAQKLAEFIVDLAWRLHRGFSVILIPVGSRVLILKSERHLPYVKCRPEPPRVMSYSENGTFVGKMSFKHFAYSKCAVRVSTSDCWDHVHMEKSNGKLVMAGFEGLVMKTIAEKYNFTIDVINPVSPVHIPSKNSSACFRKEMHNATCIREHLASGKSDLAVCSLWIMYDEDMKYSRSYMSHEVILMVPVPLYPSFTSIFRTLSKLVWIGVVLGLVVGRMFIRMNGRSISSLMALALFLGVSVTSRSRGFLEKWQYMLWVIYGYLITQSYIASLVAVLNNPSVHIIESLEELADSDIRIAGHFPFRTSFEGIDRYKRIVDNFIVMNQSEYSAAMSDPEKNIPPAKQIAILVNILDEDNWKPRYYPIKERMFYHLIGMAAMTRSTTSLREIDKTILHISQSGLFSRWFKEEVRNVQTKLNFSDIETPSPTLSLEEETGIFVVLVVGLFISILVFICEVNRKK